MMEEHRAIKRLSTEYRGSATLAIISVKLSNAMFAMASVLGLRSCHGIRRERRSAAICGTES